MNSKIKIAIEELKEIIFQKRHLCIQQCIHDENNKKGVINNDPPMNLVKIIYELKLPKRFLQKNKYI
ncbi:hypothetical protein CV174_11250 [Salmonella enterica]|nr:hypothetical protein [Salmonella enterica]